MVTSKEGTSLEQAISWASYEKFNDHLFPKVIQKAKAREFMDLVQGGVIVAEYATKFTQLLWLIIMLLIPGEDKKGNKFKRGLNPRIRTQRLASRSRRLRPQRQNRGR